jgi:dipeptidase
LRCRNSSCIQARASAFNRIAVFIAVFVGLWFFLSPNNRSQACTSIMVGKNASADGSVMTSHTCDSHRTSSDIHVVPRKRYRPNTMLQLTRRKDDNSGPMERYAREPTGKIPQVTKTYGYLAPAYAAMNEHQVAIGESTFDGRKELKSDRGLIDCETLTRLMLERSRTAREAIRVAGILLEKHGWNDVGEALTIADEKEVWVLEIVGPGKDKLGAVWAAQRVPDDSVSVVANAARIRQIDLGKPDFFMASKNVFKAAEENGWWDPKSGKPFEFAYAYNPTGRTSFSCTRREWRVLDMLAPSLKLAPNSNNYPFSIRPEKKVTPKRIMEIFRDTFEGTDFDMVKNLIVTDKDGRACKSPLANPFMPYDMNALFTINGGWGWRGERALARWYCMYATITQSRGWLPDPVGGIVWFGYDNPAMTTYVPLYAGITDLPGNFKTDGRATGFSRKSAWWAFNRVATLAAHRWGDMRKDVAQVRDVLQEDLLTESRRVDKKAAAMFKKNPENARAYLTRYVKTVCKKVVRAYWDLGDRLWTGYDEKW